MVRHLRSQVFFRQSAQVAARVRDDFESTRRVQTSDYDDTPPPTEDEQISKEFEV